jgi:hypothetical protein
MDGRSAILMDVQDRFITNFTEGGLPACRRMVADLKAEMEAAQAIEGATDDINLETILAQGNLSDEEIAERFSTTLGITDAFISAMTRHSFAAFLLDVAEKAARPKPQ